MGVQQGNTFLQKAPSDKKASDSSGSATMAFYFNCHEQSCSQVSISKSVENFS